MFLFSVCLLSLNIGTEYSNGIKLMFLERKTFFFFCYLLVVICTSGILRSLLGLSESRMAKNYFLCCPVTCIFPLSYSAQLWLHCFHSCLIRRLPTPFLGFPPCLSCQHCASQGQWGGRNKDGWHKGWKEGEDPQYWYLTCSSGWAGASR